MTRIAGHFLLLAVVSSLVANAVQLAVTRTPLASALGDAWQSLPQGPGSPVVEILFLPSWIYATLAFNCAAFARKRSPMWRASAIGGTLCAGWAYISLSDGPPAAGTPALVAAGLLRGLAPLVGTLCLGLVSPGRWPPDDQSPYPPSVARQPAEDSST